MRRSFIAFQRATGWFCFALLVAGCGGRSHSDSTTGGPSPDAGVDPGLFLVGVVDTAATACLATSDKDAPLLANGVLDVAFRSEYSAVLRVGNRLPQLGSTGPATSVTERISMRAAAITLRTAEGAELGSYSTVGIGFIDAAPAGLAAYGGVAVTLIPAALGASDALQAAHALVATIRVEGEALDGTTLTSTELNFPIQVCNGCLVRYPASALDPTVSEGGVYQCSIASDLARKTTPAPCVLGQDEPFSCVLCSEAYALCRDPQLNPSYPGP